MLRMFGTRFYMQVAFVFVFTIVLLLTAGQCGPVPKMNENEMFMPKVPQWHCLRYFKHDVIMMRRCRHLRVPTAPRLGDVKKLNRILNYNVVEANGIKHRKRQSSN